MSGGVEQKTAYLENLDLRLLIDGEKAFGAKGWSIFIYGLANHGIDGKPVPTSIVGDLQGTSNIQATTDSFRVFELWTQKMFLDDKASLLAGMHDLNSEFYFLDSSSLFLNASLGVGTELSQTGEAGPSIFPYTSPAIRLKVEPSKSFYLQTAVFEARAGLANHPTATGWNFNKQDGRLFVTETGILSEEAPSSSGSATESAPQSKYKYAFGVWNYDRTFDAIDGSGQVTSFGYYLMGDHSLGKSGTLFLRHGMASSTSNPVNSCTSGGLTWQGLIAGREDDKLGVAIARVTSGSEYLASKEAQGISLLSDEITYEILYRIEVLSGLAVIPDYQYVVHPGLSKELENAKVATLRLEFNF